MYEATNEFDKMGNTEELGAFTRRAAKVDALNSKGISIPPYNYSIDRPIKRKPFKVHFENSGQYKVLSIPKCC